MTAEDIESHMQHALNLAKKAASQDEVPVGALVLNLKTLEILSEAHNERESLQNPLAHAEVLAIERASRKIKSWRLEDCVLICTLEPCPMCLAAAQQARIEKIYYCTPDPKGGALSLGLEFHRNPKLNHRFEVEKTSGSSSQDSESLLKAFFKAKRG